MNIFAVRLFLLLVAPHFMRLYFTLLYFTLIAEEEEAVSLECTVRYNTGTVTVTRIISNTSLIRSQLTRLYPLANTGTSRVCQKVLTRPRLV